MDKLALANACSEKMHQHDRCAQSHGIEVVESTPGFAKLMMTVRDDMLNGHAICHGGMLFTLADTAFAHACNNTNQATVASRAVIEFLAPARLGETLVATASERARGGRTGVYDVEIHKAADGALVALFRGNSYQVRGGLIEENNNE